MRPKTGHPSHTYGRYQNVFLTDGELADLQASFPTVWGQYIEKLSEYMASTGKRYQSHAATIRCWACEDVKKTVTHSCNRDDSVKEDETVRLRLPQKSGVHPPLSRSLFFGGLNSCEITSQHVGKVWNQLHSVLPDTAYQTWHLYEQIHLSYF